VAIPDATLSPHLGGHVIPEQDPLHRLAAQSGVHTSYRDGLGTTVEVGPDTLIGILATLGVPVATASDAADALGQLARHADGTALPPVMVAWDGFLPPLRASGLREAVLLLEDGGDLTLHADGDELSPGEPLPMGYHRLEVVCDAGVASVTVIAAPVEGWRREGSPRAWGIGTHLAALRSRRSRSVGDLHDLEATCAWLATLGGDLVTVLPLLPTFTDPDPEPSPYAPVSRLFWSELMLDLGEHHRPSGPVETLDVRRAAAEVREALAGVPAPMAGLVDDELRHYARFRGAQARLGRNWRDWPGPARHGDLPADSIDGDVERLHLVAQLAAREQLAGLRHRLGGVRLGLDLAVGVHPDGYDPWARQHLFAAGMSVGAPPDPGFPSGQDWGFPPVIPHASRAEGHAYLAATIRHQARLAGVLRIDHIMALSRLYWIPHGFDLDQGTYVDYPADELFAILTLESHRHRCELVGENLGTVPPAIDAALARHRISGMYVAQFAAHAPEVVPPAPSEVALIGSHDTPTLAGWLGAVDVADRVRHGLLPVSRAPEVIAERAVAAHRLARHLGTSTGDPATMLEALLEWLGHSASPLVITWIEDLWLETRGINLPGTRSSEQPNWQRPMAHLLDEVFRDSAVEVRLGRLGESRRSSAD
jgi:4-alpha-glucanotransferase